jgi:hypothetical protein
VKVCIEPDCWNVTAGTRCPAHQAAKDRANYGRKKARYMKRAFRDAPITSPCECCGTGLDLTRHHITADAWVSMCRRCNSSIADRTMAGRTCPLHGGAIVPRQGGGGPRG